MSISGTIFRLFGTKIGISRPNPPTQRLCLEQLEDRTVPTAGALNPSFGGGDGIAILPTAAASQINALEILPGSKILGGGWLGADFALFKMNADGSLDLTFNADGVATADFGATTLDAIHGLALAPGGKIVAAGRSGGMAALARFDANGVLDASFDGDGKLLANLGPGDEAFFDVVVQPDEKIVAAGMVRLAPDSNASDFVVARFNADGTADTNFGGGDGMATADFGPADNVASTVLLHTDGKIIALGHAAYSLGNSGFAVARFTAEGTLDAEFANAGQFLLHLGPDYGYEDIRGAALRTDGTIVAAGQVWHHSAGPENDLVLLRLLTNGALDDLFGNGGIVVSVFENNWNEGNAMSLAADGRIVVGGDAPDLVNAHVLRYNEGGTLDADFGVTSPGRTIVDITQDDNMYAVAIQSNGDILVAGETNAHAVVLNFLPETRPAVTVNEGSQASTSITFPGLSAEITNVTSSVGSVSEDGAQPGTWIWSFNTADGPDQNQAVTVTATDSGGAASTVNIDLVVRNVAPSIALAGNAEVNKQAPYVLNLGAITDPGADTASAYTIRWGDGQTTGLIPIGNFTPQPQHIFATPGAYAIHVDLIDEDGAHLGAGRLNVTVRDAAPELKVTQTRKPISVPRNSRVVFRILLINLGNSLASGVFVNYQIAAGLTRVVAGSTLGWTATGVRRFRLNVGTLAAGQSVTLLFKARVAATARPGAVLVATATVGLDALNGPETNLANNRYKISVVVL